MQNHAHVANCIIQETVGIMDAKMKRAVVMVVWFIYTRMIGWARKIHDRNVRYLWLHRAR